MEKNGDTARTCLLLLIILLIDLLNARPLLEERVLPMAVAG